MAVLIVGMGEIGKALKQVEQEAGNTVYEQDIGDDAPVKDYNMMHICIGYSERFRDIVANYKDKFNPDRIIIHSTIPPSEYGEDIAHSFCTGVHPHLYEGLNTFKKFANRQRAVEYLCSIGLKAEFMNGTELAKILSTSYYGFCILYAKEVNKLCKEYGLDYEDVYTRTNNNYNEGYKKLGKDNVVRPVLYPPDGTIGGHCVSANRELLPDCNIKEFSKIMNR